jgi:tRNA CCA-adding enzyme
MKRKRRGVNSVLKDVLKKVEPGKEELKIIENSLRVFLYRLEKKIDASKISAEIFVGGSFAKGTLIKKEEYDIDIFVRFDKKYREKEFHGLLKKILKGEKNMTLVHGSRDYFRMNIAKNLFFEIIPVKKVKNPREAENITDLSYSHVNYIKRKLKNKKFFDEIRLAKAFCYATNSYGAESYIQGFSGYGLELLIYHYKSFLKFARAVVKMGGKEIIDIEKHYKNKNQILMDLNASKLHSPIILIDPTYKQRNALAALSEETFQKFRKACRDFLKNPGAGIFESKKIDLEKIMKNARKKRYESILLRAKTSKQEGDIAGSKLLKFHRYLEQEISRFFDIKGKGFEYLEGKSARYLFVAKKKRELLISGPSLKQKEHVRKFKKKHKKVFAKKGKIHTRKKIKSNLKKFIQDWRRKHKKITKDMYITELKVLG